MATARLDSLIHNLTSIEKKVTDTIQGVIKENEAWIVELNSEDQLFEKGINRKGVSLGDYAKKTIAIKKGKGQPTNRVTLRDTGDFHKSFYIEYNADGFEIMASDGITNKLLDIYGEEILGLDDENMHDISEHYVKPELIKLFKSL